MLIFGYRHSSSGYIRAAIAILLGLLLMVWPGHSSDALGYIVGAFILLIGIVSIVTAFYMRGMRTIVASLVSASITTVVGILILNRPDYFVKVIVFLLGILLLIFGLYQFFSLFSVRKVVRVPLYDFILTGISAAAGLVMVFNPFRSGVVIMIFVGAGVFVYGIATLLATFRIRAAMKDEEQAQFSTYEDVSDKAEEKE